MFSLCGQIELYKEDFFNTTTVLKNKPFLTVSRAFNHNFIYQENASMCGLNTYSLPFL